MFQAPDVMARRCRIFELDRIRLMNPIFITNRSQSCSHSGQHIRWNNFRRSNSGNIIVNSVKGHAEIPNAKAIASAKQRPDM